MTEELSESRNEADRQPQPVPRLSREMREINSTYRTLMNNLRNEYKSIHEDSKLCLEDQQNIRERIDALDFNYSKQLKAQTAKERANKHLIAASLDLDVSGSGPNSPQKSSQKRDSQNSVSLTNICNNFFWFLLGRIY